MTLDWKKPILSYSTINMLLTSSHQWANKINKIPKDPHAGEYMKPDGTIGSYFTEGREGHSLIQGHISGKNKSDRVIFDKEAPQDLFFPLVEECDFDKRMMFLFMVGQYQVIGYADGLNKELKRGAEIKLSGTPWSLSKYLNSNQRKLYGLGFPWLEEMFLITGKRIPSEWEKTPLKVHHLPFEEKDKKAAMEFVEQGIEVIESGIYTGGLNENGICTDRNCMYGPNCMFK